MINYSVMIIYMNLLYLAHHGDMQVLVESLVHAKKLGCTRKN